MSRTPQCTEERLQSRIRIVWVAVEEAALDHAVFHELPPAVATLPFDVPSILEADSKDAPPESAFVAPTVPAADDAAWPA